MSIYYLIASLPTLGFGMKLPLTSQEFLTECQRLLTAVEFALVKQALCDQENSLGHPTVRAWKEFYKDLRNEMALFRATEQNKDPLLFLRGQRQEQDLAMTTVLVAAAKASDPLAAEKILDLFIWEKFESLGAQHYFDIDQLIVYGLKLKMIERYAVISSQQGLDKFAELKAAAAEKYL